MNINYNDYFKALGFNKTYYDAERKEIDKDEVTEEIEQIIEEWSTKYPRLQFNTESLRFDSLLNFNHSFTREMTNLRFD